MALKNDFSKAEIKRHLGAWTGLGVILYGSKRHLGNDTEMELCNAFLRCLFRRALFLHAFSPLCRFTSVPFLHTFSPAFSYLSLLSTKINKDSSHSNGGD